VPHDTWLVATITIALGAAFVGGLIAARLHLPPIVGYLLAGVAVGPFTPGLVADTAVTQQLAEIGIVLLMFGVGIHFSPRQLLAVRRIALPGAVLQSAATTGIGLLLGLWWGWGVSGGLMLGLALSVASTIVLLRALEERDELVSAPGRIAVGWLIAEDLFTVVVLVLLPTLAGSGATGGGVVLEVALAIGKVALLGAFMVLVGSRVVPLLLLRVANSGPREMFTLGVLAVALGIAYGASRVFGVSLALGAFLAGLTLAESNVCEQAAADALPLRDAFAVLFFVSVGMLFDPKVLLAHPWHVLAVLVVILAAKPLLASVVVLAFGYPRRVVLTVAAGLAQVGEFSFILAQLGVALGSLPQEGYALIIAGSLLCITANPFAFRSIAPLEGWLTAHPRLLRLPARHRPSAASSTALAPPDDPDDRGRGCAANKKGGA
jgi:monovalent cation:H+ antiporter-2, CPA2 family